MTAAHNTFTRNFTQHQPQSALYCQIFTAITQPTHPIRAAKTNMGVLTFFWPSGPRWPVVVCPPSLSVDYPELRICRLHLVCLGLSSSSLSFRQLFCHAPLRLNSMAITAARTSPKLSCEKARGRRKRTQSILLEICCHARDRGVFVSNARRNAGELGGVVC